jgi:formylglycine-generating enzyme required for sulfatase activity/serine/threonine protein kinase
MTDEELLADLMIQWEEALDEGRDVSAADLCKDCPHLVGELSRRIEALKGTSWMDKPVDGGGENSPVSDSPAPDTPPRTLVNRYRLDQKVAEGGFAQVWKGYDLELLRTVAVKMPKPSHIGAVDSFMAEARRVARLKHPGIVPVHDVGKDGDDFFIVSEFVEDGSLGDRLKQGPIPPEQSCRWLAEIADALDYAHKNGVIHRDIKPANILIDHHGRALLADFGIALSANKTGQFAPSIGTLAYMSPEQLEGKPLDPRSDVYSVGVLLCQLLTGKLPYDARDTNCLRKEIVSGAIRLSGSGEKMTPELRGICLKCLAHDPKERYATAKDLANDLRSVQPIKSHRTALVISGIAVLVTLLSVPFVWKAVFRSNEGGVAERLNDSVPLGKLTRQIGPEDGLKLPIGLMATDDGQIHVANTGRGNIRVYSPSGLLLREYGVPGRKENQLRFPQFFATSIKRDSLAITDYGRNCVSLFSTDGRFLKSFSALGDGRTRMNKPRGLAINKADDLFIVDSGNHRILVFTYDGTFLRSVGSAGSGLNQLRAPSGIAIASDGRMFVADTGNRRIVVFNADDSVAMVIAHEQPRTEPFALAFSPSGRLFVSDHFHECIQVFDKELKHLGSLRPSDGEFLPMGLAFLPNGQLAVANYKQQSVCIFDVGEQVVLSDTSQSKRPDPITNSIGMVLVHIPAGEFLMGTPENDPSKAWDEIPHRVRISKPFFMGKYEVTQEQYQKVMGKNPSYCARLPNPEQHPVEQVSWDDAVAFCRALSDLPDEKAAGRSYRLPTEAEWEYACRAGTTTAYHFGNDSNDLSKYALFGGHKAGVWATQKVGIKLPNAWGLHDMHGNVWEWCADEYGPYRVETEVVDPQGPDKGVGKVARGGSWDYGAVKCRSAQRYGGEVLTRSFTNFAFGFRVVMVQEARP